MASVIIIASLTFAFSACSKDSHTKSGFGSEDTSEVSGSGGQATKPSGDSSRRVVAIQKGELSVFQPTVGTLFPRQLTRIGAQVSGRVDEVLVDAGRGVKKGQVLLKLDQTQFLIRLQRAQAELKAASSNFTSSQLDFERMKNLWENPKGDQPSIPRKRYDDALSDYEQAEARVALANEAVALSQYELDETEVKAPYDGMVTERFVDPGQPVTATPVTHLLEIQDLAELHLEFTLPQSMLSGVRSTTELDPGTPVEFWIDGMPESKRDGRIQLIFPAVDQDTRSFKCRVIVDNADGAFRPGLLVEVRVQVLSVQDVLLVPREAVRRIGGEMQVTVVTDKGEQSRAIGVGQEGRGHFEILTGLREGERIVIPSGG
ncbi:MAG: efflux RND transporter periplasmic adaptor subunit [Planctomycetota bacterium]